MTRRRPSARPVPAHAPRRPVAGPPVTDGSTGLWYAALIGGVLLIALGLYALHLYRQAMEWRDAADQLTIGQELLRADRDEILQKARDREVTLSTLEAAREQDRRRLAGLEEQRRRLQADVLRLTQDLARSERQGAGAAPDGSGHDQERERLDRDLARRGAEVERLNQALAEKTASLDKAVADLDRLQAATDDLVRAQGSLEQEKAQLAAELAARRDDERRRQIMRGHQASLGEIRPYIAELGPGDWSVIEDWLAVQLGRPMALPDLSARGFSYEGARLIGSADGPPMVMLLYADAEDRPVSLTIVKDRRGEQPLAERREGGLNWLEWREERHAFTLVGATDRAVLQAVAIDLINQPPRQSADAPVPASRHVRPSFRPDDRT